jgi:CBS domain-containing protein
MKVADLMTREVVSVPPGASLKEAAGLLIERGISGLPVVDAEGGVLGVLSETDIVAAEAGGSRTLVGQAMTAPAVTIDADRLAVDAAKLMVADSVNRLPVLENGKLVGILTRADLVRAFVRTDTEIAEEIRNDAVVRSLWPDPHSLRVEVEEGAVTISGVLDSHTDEQLLSGYVRRVPGVVSVRTELTWENAGSDPVGGATPVL